MKCQICGKERPLSKLAKKIIARVGPFQAGFVYCKDNKDCVEKAKLVLSGNLERTQRKPTCKHGAHVLCRVAKPNDDTCILCLLSLMVDNHQKMLDHLATISMPLLTSASILDESKLMEEAMMGLKNLLSGRTEIPID